MSGQLPGNGRPSQLPASRSTTAAGASRFGFRAPSATTTAATSNAPSASGPASRPPAAAAVPPTPSTSGLGKRTASSTSFGGDNHAYGSGAGRLSHGPPPSASSLASASSKKHMSSMRSSSRAGSTGGPAGSASGSPGPTSASPRPPSPSAAHQLAVLKSQYEAQLLASKQSYDGLEEEFREMAGEVERLKSERRELLENWDQNKERQAAEKEEWKREKETLTRANSQLQARDRQREEEMQDLRETSAKDRQELHSRIHELSTRASRAQSEREEAAERLTAEEAARKAETGRREEAEQKVSHLEQHISELQSKKSDQDGGHAVLEQQLHQILADSRKLESQVRDLTSANAALVKQAEGSAILKEENLGLKKKVETIADLQQQLVEHEERANRQRQELEQWDSLLSSTDSASAGTKLEAQSAIDASALENPLPTLPSAPLPLSRTTLPPYLASLRGTLAGTLTRCQILASKLKTATSLEAGLVEELEGAQKQLEEARRATADWRAKEEEWKHSRSGWEEEARRYRDLLKTYEQESAINGASARPRTSNVKAELQGDSNAEDVQMEEGDGAKDATASVVSSAAQLERISLLEHELQLKTSELQELHSSHEERCEKLKAETQRDLAELDTLRAQVQQLEGVNAKLDEALGRAEERLGFGEFNTDNYRCLVLKQNPVDADRDLRTSTMNRLKAENEELVGRVEELSKEIGKIEAARGTIEQGPEASLSAGSAAAQGLVPASTVENLREEIKGLLESIKVKDKAMLRLKQVYTQKASEFRSAIQSLFGFKVRFLESGQVRLNSTFARSAKATSLVFKSDANDVGQMRLAGEAVNDVGLANIPHLRDYWLGAHGMRQSVPCFLAALQLELYESTTQAVRGAWAVPDAEEGEEDE